MRMPFGPNQRRSVEPAFGPEAVDGASLRQWLTGALGRVHESETEVRLGTANYTRTWLVTGYPEGPAYVGRLDRLLRFHLGDPMADRIQVRITQHLIPSALPDDLQTRWLRKRQEGMVAESAIHGTPDAATAKGLRAYNAIYNAVAFAEDRVFEIWMAIHVTAPDPESLSRMEQRLLGEVAAMNMAVTPLFKEQIEGLALGHVLGLRQTRLLQAWPGRMTHTAPLSYLYPFLHGTISQGRGVYVGHEMDDLGFRHAAYVDFARAQAMNWVICGKTGEGKTTLERTLSTGLLAEGFQVTQYDASREYKDFCDFVGGVHVDMTIAGGRYFEPLEIPSPAGEPEYDAGRLMRASQLFHCVVAGLAPDLTPRERQVADQVLMALWRGAGVERDRPETWNGPGARKATIQEWYRLLRDQPDEPARNLRDKLAMYFEGTAPMFVQTDETIWSAEVPFYRISVDAVTNDAIMETVAAVKSLIATQRVWNAIVANKAAGLRYAMVCVSEGQRVLRVPDMAQHLYVLATDGRKFNAGLSICANDVSVFHETTGGQGLWENATFRALFYMEESAIQRAAERSQIPEQVLAQLRSLHGTYQYMMTCDLQQWARARVELPDLELNLARTRGLRVS